MTRFGNKRRRRRQLKVERPGSSLLLGILVSPGSFVVGPFPGAGEVESEIAENSLGARSRKRLVDHGA